MINHVWTVLCRRCVVDTRTNNLSMFDVVEQVIMDYVLLPKTIGPIAVPTTDSRSPMSPPDFEIVTLWERIGDDDLRTAQTRILLENPAPDTTVLGTNTVNLTSHQRSRSIATLYGVQFEVSGRHLFHIEIRYSDAEDWIRKFSLPLYVELKKIG